MAPVRAFAGSELTWTQARRASVRVNRKVIMEGWDSERGTIRQTRRAAAARGVADGLVQHLQT